MKRLSTWSGAQLHPWTRNSAVALLLLCLSAILLVALAWQARWSRYNHDLQQLEQRIERLDGIMAAGDEIDARLIAAQTATAPWLHPGGDGASNQIVQQLRDLIVANDGTLASSQTALVTAEDGGLERVRVSATISGEWPQLMRILAALQTHQPSVWVNSANLMQSGSRTEGAAQTARLSLQLDAPLAGGEPMP